MGCRETARCGGIVKLPPYPKYKPGVVEWLGEVPEYWELKRLMHLTDRARQIMYDIVLSAGDRRLAIERLGGNMGS